MAERHRAARGCRAACPAPHALCSPVDDGLHEECGVFGIWAPGADVARLTYFGLHALQHRGQESAGIAVGDGSTVLIRKDLGLVNQVFSEADLAALQGKVALGHVRYCTSGQKNWEGAQPHLAAIDDVIIALAHNGTLVNTDQLRVELERRSIEFRSATDTEVAAKLIGYYTQKTHRIRDGIAKTMRLIRGAYAMAVIRENALYAFRDPNGIRPLLLGELPDGRGWVVASETCALSIVGARYVRDIAPGEVLRISDDGLKTMRGIEPSVPAQCIFEQVYFSRPDSIVDGRSVYSTRFAMGAQLAHEVPASADIVVGVPDSGLPGAEGFASASRLPVKTGFIKDRYVARTFIQPSQELRELGVRLKLNALSDVVRGQRVVLVDDSIVRGTTMNQIVRLVREAGATEVHVRVNSPEVTWPCFYGIDTATQDQLISANMSVEGIREFIGADSLGFLSVAGLLRAAPRAMGYCAACFTGEYPVPIPESFSEGSFLAGYEPKRLSRAGAALQMRIEDLAREAALEAAEPKA